MIFVQQYYVCTQLHEGVNLKGYTIYRTTGECGRSNNAHDYRVTKLTTQATIQSSVGIRKKSSVNEEKTE